MVAQAVEALAALHAVPWEPRREAWGEPLSLADEMKRLDNLLDRPDARPQGRRTRTAIARTLASKSALAGARSRWMCAWRLPMVEPFVQRRSPQGSHRLGAVADRATLIDLGWLSLFSDRESWETQDLIPQHVLPPDEIAKIYASKASSAVDREQVRWFRAFAGYRFGVITAFNLMLHRRGKRPDPTWEDIALSGPRLFERGLELLG